MGICFTPKRLTVSLDDNLGSALAAMSQADLRPPKQQLQWLIQQEAQRRGLVKSEGDVQPASTPVTFGLNA